MAEKTFHRETLAVHGGWRADPATGAIIPPIYNTASYQFPSAESAADRFALKELGYIYSRLGNPTVDALEQRIVALDGGAAAVGVSAGQAASAFAIENVANSGDNIVSGTDVYGGTHNLFAHSLAKLGIEVRFVDPTDPGAFARATDDRTRAYYLEMLPNPKLVVPPVEDIAASGRKLGIPLIVDNTSAPYLARPFDHGAAITVYSATKYLCGHGTAIAGLVVDSGNFDWAAFPDRQPNFNKPDPSYHGIVWTEAAKPLGPIAFALRIRAILLRDFGSALSPFDAFTVLQGIETLPLRMPKHSANAATIANWLAQHPKVASVIHPSQQSGADRARAEKYLKGGFGGLMGFVLKDGDAAGQKFVESLKLFYHVANLGDTRSLAIHPASTTHSQLTAKELLEAGITPGYVRLSIGIEHTDDLIADLEQALAAV